jgi:hypothetical protein
MSVCDDVKKMMDLREGTENRKKRSARSRLRPEKAVIDSPRFAPHAFYFWEFGAVPLWGRLRNPLGGLAQWASFY